MAKVAAIYQPLAVGDPDALKYPGVAGFGARMNINDLRR
jgi:hypothetical protein